MITFVELEKVWKQKAVTYFKVLSHHWPEETEENHENRILILPLTF
jgi:hypothetical protein